MRLAGKVAIITGGTRGIGLAIAHSMAREGARVVISGRDPETGMSAEKQVDRAFFIKADVSEQEQAHSLIKKTLDIYGRIDILVNNAGIHAAAPFVEESPELWNRMFGVNVMGTVFTSQFVVPAMIQQGGGRIVHIASKAGVVGEPGHAAYSASKGAVIALTRAMAIELAQYRITVNAVCPGPVLTNMLRGVFPEEEKQIELGKEAPLGRIGCPEDIVGAVLLFASDESDWCTGQVLSVDGGFSVLK